jgi:hypothetical protein
MAKSPVKTDLERRAWRAMLVNAFFRWESAATIALTILLAFFLPQPFPGWQWWFWLIGGALAEAAVVYSSLSDPEFRSRVVREMLRQEFDPEEVQDAKYRGYLEQAIEYRERIEEAVARRRKGILRDHFEETARQIDDWIRNIYQVARRLDGFDEDDLIHRDLERVPRRIEELEQQLANEDDPRVREQLEETLGAKRDQYENLQQLGNDMQRAELQLEHSLTAMGTIYSQLLRVGAKDVDSSRVRRLRDEMADEVRELQDVLDSMDEVYETSSIA